MPDWQEPSEVERWRDSDYKALAQHLDDRPLLRYIIGYFWRYHCDAETWTATAKKYSTFLQGSLVHGWCLLEGWLPFGTREGAQDISVLSIFGPEPQSLLRFKRWLASGTGGRRDATYFSADAENNFPLVDILGLVPDLRRSQPSRFYFTSRAEFAFSTSVEFSSAGYPCGPYMFSGAYRVRRPGGADTSSF